MTPRNQLPLELQKNLKYPRTSGSEKIVTVSLATCYLALAIAGMGVAIAIFPW
jgi:hypothetical protein